MIKGVKQLKDNLDFKDYDIGSYTYGLPKILDYKRKIKPKLKIGRFCSIGKNVTIFLSYTNHNYLKVSSYPFDYLLNGKINEKNNSDVIIGNDVWIGYDVFINSGIEIGDGAVIGSKSVVTKNVNPYEIVGGNPIKNIKYRFTENQINKLLKIKWWDWNIEKILENVNYINNENIDEFITKFHY